MSEQAIEERTWTIDELTDECPNCGLEVCDSSLVREQVQMPCGTWHRTKKYRLRVGKVCALTAALAAKDAEVARLTRELGEEREFIDLLTTEKHQAEMDLENASMCIRRLLHRLGKHEPDIDMIKQINDWLVRKGLQGSVLRTEAPPKEQDSDAK